jgi:8-oxo-dGTP pyrophosphatase MutT (NUDIX family)
VQVYLLPYFVGTNGVTMVLGVKNIFGTKSKGTLGVKKIIWNNAGQVVISGGGKRANENETAGAQREFGEETGIDLRVAQERADMGCIGGPVPLEIKVGEDTFWCVYQKVRPDSLILKTIDHNTRLKKVWEDELHNGQQALASDALQVFGPRPLDGWRAVQYRELDPAGRADADRKMQCPYDWFIAAAMLIRAADG